MGHSPNGCDVLLRITDTDEVMHMKDEYRKKGSKTPAVDPQPPPPPPPPMPSETSVFLLMYLDSAVCMDVRVYSFACMHEECHR